MFLLTHTMIHSDMKLVYFYSPNENNTLQNSGSELSHNQMPYIIHADGRNLTIQEADFLIFVLPLKLFFQRY